MKYKLILLLFFIINIVCKAFGTEHYCRVNSEYREENEPCYEMPQHYDEPDRLKEHVDRLREIAGFINRRTVTVGLPMGELSHYMDTVITPHLTTYYRNIDSNYQASSVKILNNIKGAINNAIINKEYIYNNLTLLANELNVPKICDEERRAAKTLASEHVAKTYECTETVRAIIDKVVKYSNDIMSIVKSHMDDVVFKISSAFDSNKVVNVTAYIKELSNAAVRFGYELDLCLTNARRQSDGAADKLSNCKASVKRYTEEMTNNARNELYQCVYA